MTTVTASATSSEILRRAGAFVSETLSKREFRHRLFSILLRCETQTSLNNPLNLAVETIENAIFTTSPSTRSSSLRLAEKLLLSHPANPLSSILLSLIYSLCNRPLDSALSLLDLFQSDPSLARSEIAPSLFEELFLVHLLPVLQCLNEQRSQILSSLSPITNGDCDKDDDYSIRDASVAVPCALSKMSGGQASELKELQSKYEQVVDENCRNLAKYFIEVLENKDGDKLMKPPPAILKPTGKSRMLEYAQEQRIQTRPRGLKNGRYNVMLYILFLFFFILIPHLSIIMLLPLIIFKFLFIY